MFPRVEAVLHSVLATRSTFILTMPSLLETVSANPEDIQKLVPLEFVVRSLLPCTSCPSHALLQAFGGAALRKSAGDALVQAGVKLIAVWGMNIRPPHVVVALMAVVRHERDGLRHRCDEQ